MKAIFRRWPLLVQLLTAVTISSLLNLKLLSRETRMAQATSDVAFDKGDLKESLKEAQYASLMSNPDSQYFGEATDRLEAIAVGSEATGRPKTALLAWSCLSATYMATKSAVSSNSRLAQQSEQHIAYLLSKVSNRATAEALHSEPLTSSSLRLPNHRLVSAPELIGLGLLVGVIGLLLKRQPAGTKMGAKVVGRGLYVFAATCWCIGWLVT